MLPLDDYAIEDRHLLARLEPYSGEFTELSAILVASLSSLPSEVHEVSGAWRIGYTADATRPQVTQLCVLRSPQALHRYDYALDEKTPQARGTAGFRLTASGIMTDYEIVETPTHTTLPLDSPKSFKELCDRALAAADTVAIDETWDAALAKLPLIDAQAIAALDPKSHHPATWANFLLSHCGVDIDRTSPILQRLIDRPNMAVTVAAAYYNDHRILARWLPAALDAYKAEHPAFHTKQRALLEDHLLDQLYALRGRALDAQTFVVDALTQTAALGGTGNFVWQKLATPTTTHHDYPVDEWSDPDIW